LWSAQAEHGSSIHVAREDRSKRNNRSPKQPIQLITNR
jgi:hypothetical protein